MKHGIHVSSVASSGVQWHQAANRRPNQIGTAHLAHTRSQAGQRERFLYCLHNVFLYHDRKSHIYAYNTTVTEALRSDAERINVPYNDEQARRYRALAKALRLKLEGMCGKPVRFAATIPREMRSAVTISLAHSEVSGPEPETWEEFFAELF